MGAALVARRGRQLQRYTPGGRRLVVGCIPYKVKADEGEPAEDAMDVDKVLEVLVISSQKGKEILFPKGGWEKDESMEQAASREAMEEAGVRGNLEEELGEWGYRGKSGDSRKTGIMFPLKVTEELHLWPEMDRRQRRWVTAAEAMEVCRQQWMRAALEKLVDRLSASAPGSRSAAQRQPALDSGGGHGDLPAAVWMPAAPEKLVDRLSVSVSGGRSAVQRPLDGPGAVQQMDSGRCSSRRSSWVDGPQDQQLN